MGGGDYSLDVANLGIDESLIIGFDDTTEMQVVFSTPSLVGSAVAVSEISSSGPTITITGTSIEHQGARTVSLGAAGNGGVCAVIIEGKLYARIALYNSGQNLSVEDCFALPLPLFAYVEGQNIEPISIADNAAGWGLFGNQARVRIAGYNLPTNLKYRAGSESVLQDMTADGGDYGIEFTQPDLTTFIMILDGTYWLFLDRR